MKYFNSNCYSISMLISNNKHPLPNQDGKWAVKMNYSAVKVQGL